MELRSQLKGYLRSKGVRSGKMEVLKMLEEVATEINITGVPQFPRTESNLLNFVFDRKPDDTIPEFEVHDPVKIKELGMWDNYLTKGNVYIVHKVTDECIVIKDDSGDLNPYLKSRFINLSKRNLVVN